MGTSNHSTNQPTTFFVEMNPSSDATRPSTTKGFPQIIFNPKIHSHVQEISNGVHPQPVE
jgi:hypothetical protein